MPVALAESWQQNRYFAVIAKARKFVVLLVAHSDNEVGSNLGVPVVGLSAGKWFLAYLPL